jgi:hypothetical protein
MTREPEPLKIGEVMIPETFMSPEVLHVSQVLAEIRNQREDCARKLTVPFVFFLSKEKHYELSELYTELISLEPHIARDLLKLAEDECYLESMF